MNSNGFFKKIREIIREEIEIALEKKVSKKEVNKASQKRTLEHGMSLYTEAQKSTKKSVTPKTNFNSIQDILNETRRTLNETADMENEFRFTADMAEGFGYERGSTPIPQGYSSNEIPDEVMSALTKDYSALMKKIEEKKGR
jgi:hypothetical protein